MKCFFFVGAQSVLVLRHYHQHFIQTTYVIIQHKNQNKNSKV